MGYDIDSIKIAVEPLQLLLWLGEGFLEGEVVRERKVQVSVGSRNGDVDMRVLFHVESSVLY